MSAPVLVTGLFDPLPSAGHELVLFDINRFSDIEPLLKEDPAAWLDEILKNADASFTISVVANESEDQRAVVLRRREAYETKATQESLGMRWPEGLYSLAHVALPFAPGDPLYGGPEAGESPGVQLGSMALRGERGVLQVSAANMLRLHWNPFYPYIEERIVDIVAELAPQPR